MKVQKSQAKEPFGPWRKTPYHTKVGRYAVKMTKNLLLAPLALASLVAAQQDSELSARALYYLKATQGAKASPSTQESKPVKAVKNVAGNPPSRTTTPNTNVTPVSFRPVSHVLGLRYTVQLVDAASGKSTPVSPDRAFKSGECIALELESNEAGFIYILQQGSSGNWSPLMPSAAMPEESNKIEARKSMRLPSQHCFKFDTTAGTERMFVVLARNEEALHDLNQAVRKSARKPAPESNSPAPAEPEKPMLIAANLNQQVEMMRADLRSRDLSIQRVAQPASADEPAHSVYVVNVSPATDTKNMKPGDIRTGNRVVTEITLKHQ